MVPTLLTVAAGGALILSAVWIIKKSIKLLAIVILVAVVVSYIGNGNVF